MMFRRNDLLGWGSQHRHARFLHRSRAQTIRIRTFTCGQVMETINKILGDM
jgi:hypothetical protein